MGLTFPEILLRSKEGSIIEEKQFDLSIFKKTQELKKKYNIRYDPDHPLDLTGSLADRVFEAGRELFLDIGAYCTTTRRVIKVTERELDDEIAACPDEIVLGQGQDRVKMVHRSVEGSEKPVVIAGLQTTPHSDEGTMFTIYRLCALDRCVDGIWGGILLTIDGTYEVIAGTPSEIYQYRKTIPVMRRAIEAAGRSGMIIINNAPTSPATIAMFDEQDGMRHSDFIESTGMSEMKLAYDDLNRTAYGLAHGVAIHGAHSSVIGGFSATPEGAAIVAVAASLQLVVIHRSAFFRCGAVDSRIKSRVTRGQLWVAGTAIQGLSRNIVSTVMGGHSAGGTRKYVVGETCNYGTPLESRWMGEICAAAVGVSREQADRIVTYLLERYEDRIKDAPAGDTFEHLYDQRTLQPIPAYETIYNEVKSELRQLGMRISD
jgi:methylamine--corrinoid protein Co-methyltransferase